MIAIVEHPKFKVCRKQPSLDSGAVPIIGSLTFNGYEHLGHLSALSETSVPHSGQLINAIFNDLVKSKNEY